MTTQESPPALPTERRFRLDWLIPALIRPRATFAAIAAQSLSVWLVPLLLLTVVVVIRSAVGGSIQQAALAAAPVELPPDLPPEQVEQMQQAQSMGGGPLFVYVFPTLLAVAGVWVGWLLVGGLLHLLLTLIGGRGSTRSSLNVVAWAALPFVLREVVRLVYMLIAGRLIGHPGLSGFAPEGSGPLEACALAVFGQVDLYLLWHIALIGLGARVSDQLPRGRALAGAAVTVLLVMGLRAAPGTVFALLGAFANRGSF